MAILNGEERLKEKPGLRNRGAYYKAKFKSYNMVRNEVVNLVSGNLNVGVHTVFWKVNDLLRDRLEKGMFYCKLFFNQRFLHEK